MLGSNCHLDNLYSYTGFQVKYSILDIQQGSEYALISNIPEF